MRAAFAGKVCVVTGGAAGIGEAVCLAFASGGARIAVLDVRAAQAAAVAARIDGAAAFACDVSDSCGVDSTIADVPGNNAGTIGGDDYRRNLARRVSQMQELDRDGAISSPLNAVVDMSDAEWRPMLAIHLDGIFHCKRAALRHMQRGAAQPGRQPGAGTRRWWASRGPAGVRCHAVAARTVGSAAARDGVLQAERSGVGRFNWPVPARACICNAFERRP